MRELVALERPNSLAILHLEFNRAVPAEVKRALKCSVDVKAVVVVTGLDRQAARVKDRRVMAQILRGILVRHIPIIPQADFDVLAGV
jgi:hypothetical protein